MKNKLTAFLVALLVAYCFFCVGILCEAHQNFERMAMRDLPKDATTRDIMSDAMNAAEQWCAIIAVNCFFAGISTGMIFHFFKLRGRTQSQPS